MRAPEEVAVWEQRVRDGDPSLRRRNTSNRPDLPTMTPEEIAAWEQRLRDGELAGYPGFTAIDALRASIAAHPDWYAAKHAAAIGVSRERVRQLQAKHGITLPRGRRLSPLATQLDGAEETR